MSGSHSENEIRDAVENVFLGVAENPLLHEELAQYITGHFSIESGRHLGYGVGPRGSPRLKKALASFFDAEFRAHEPVKDDEILIFPGVISLLDSLTWSICDEGEGIIVPLPYYTGFQPAVKERSRGVLIPASFQSLDGYHGLDDIFEPEMNRRALENALAKASQGGVRARAVLLSNPHNPIGRCYPKETLQEIARFCGHHGLHLVSDEIFAQSVYETPLVDATPFTSILSLDLIGCIDRHLVHVAYGMSKDFCANGFRLAALHSRNEGLLVAVTSICVFSWAPYITQDIWAGILEDREFSVTFAARNRQLLREHYSIMTQFFDVHKIRYYQKT
ncbi:hypothetical protein VSDG_09606 [Cytospora chrysosperma]|uniref:Aminotransferase class I/classII large domain-containing protein n=1 Tax=Cytospora chrysosperma TaxID=252740 RepID=A0A423V9P5_CYTCH|nr:hypothetical protein VSDG_09606 [Valsa sordida]